MTGIAATAVIHTRPFITRRYGNPTWEKVLRKLEWSTRELYERELNPRSWVDYDRVVNLFRTIKEVLGDQHPRVLIELGKHNGEANLRITQRIVMKLASVDFVLRIAAKLYKGRVRDGGTLKIVHRDRGHVKALLTDAPDPQPEWHEYLAGWFVRTIELSGGCDVRVELVKSGSRPYETTEFDCSWS